MRKTITLGIVLILCLFAFVGCSNSKFSQMANELRFSLKGISSLTISYNEEKITFFESDGDDLVIKEYMTENKNASVSTTFQQDVTVNGRTTSGVVGDNPTVTVKVETNNGNIEVRQ